MTAAHNLPTEAGTVAGGDVVKLVDAAAELGLKLGTLRRLIDEGMPTVRRASAGGGRGNTTLLHLPTVRRSLAARDQPAQPVEALLLTLAAELPHVLAEALDTSSRMVEGPHKVATLRALAGSWVIISNALIGSLARHGCDLPPELGRDDLPPAMLRLLNSELQSKR